MSAAGIYLGVGANLAPREHLPLALEQLRRVAPVVAVSTCYWTAPLGRPEQPPYVNSVWQVETDLGPLALREALRRVEEALGRRRTADRFASRTLDLDLILHGETVLTTGPLRLPDPDLRVRPFLALPLYELAPTLRLPGTGEPLARVIRALDGAALRPDPALTADLRGRLASSPVA